MNDLPFNLFSFFESTAMKFSNSLAIYEDNDKNEMLETEFSLTYSQVLHCCNLLSSLLLLSHTHTSDHFLSHYNNVGLVQGEVVGVYMPRSIEQIIAILSIWKAGCILLYLDPTFPILRLQEMIDESHVRLILFCQLENEDKNIHDLVRPSIGILPISRKVLLSTFCFCHFPLELLMMAFPTRLLQSQPNDSLPLLSQTSMVAYIIFTSGSTGKPKGVKGHHEGIYLILKSFFSLPLPLPNNTTPYFKISFNL
jgi:non-ribosomal peptide synthetase component F